MVLTDSSMAGNIGGQCGGGTYMGNDVGWPVASSELTISNSEFLNNTADWGGAVCSTRTIYYHQSTAASVALMKALADAIDFYTPLKYPWNPEVASNKSMIAISRSVLASNTAKDGLGWDIYADANTTVKVGKYVSIHRQSESVFWKRNCTFGEVATVDSSCTPCPINSYSIKPRGLQSMEQCERCNDSVDCFGGALITPHSGMQSEPPMMARKVGPAAPLQK
jgi:hypothetical protein